MWPVSTVVNISRVAKLLYWCRSLLHLRGQSLDKVNRSTELSQERFVLSRCCISTAMCAKPYPVSHPQSMTDTTNGDAAYARKQTGSSFAKRCKRSCARWQLLRYMSMHTVTVPIMWQIV